jgi:hypothetical protein
MNNKTAKEILVSKVEEIYEDAFNGLIPGIVEAMEEYASPLKKRITELESFLQVETTDSNHDFGCWCPGCGKSRLNKAKKRIEELEAASKEILRFKISLDYAIEKEFQYPPNCLTALNRLEELLNPSTNGKQD